MFISRNTTGLSAGLSVTTDKHARDHCVVVIKGTFCADARGELRPAEPQHPLVYADEHYGDPGATSIRHECDFAPVKPFTDVLLHGHAVSPTERPIARMSVRVEMPGRVKEAHIIGERTWERGLTGLIQTPPRPFTRMPLRFERTFGGTDQSHHDPRRHGSDLRNPVGVGFFCAPNSAAAAGAPLPNIEDPRSPKGVVISMDVLQQGVLVAVPLADIKLLPG